MCGTDDGHDAVDEVERGKATANSKSAAKDEAAKQAMAAFGWEI